MSNVEESSGKSGHQLPMDVDMDMDTSMEDDGNGTCTYYEVDGEERNTTMDIGVISNPSMDLEGYINSYTGMTKLLRLMHISDHFPALKIQALKMAIKYVEGTCNVKLYQKLHKTLQEAAAVVGSNSAEGGSGAATVTDLPQMNQGWIDEKTKTAASKLEKLVADLNVSKANSFKEGIRSGHIELGEYYLDVGDMQNAYKCFSRAREYSTTPDHINIMCLNAIKISVYGGSWNNVLSHATKGESSNVGVQVEGEKSSLENLCFKTKLRCAAGLAELATGQYKAAAKRFLVINLEHFYFSDMISANNIAVYAALCALATFDRNELQTLVISNQSFKSFLEIEPQIRDIISAFQDCKYAICFGLLDEIMVKLLLDLYLAPHVTKLYKQIRQSGIIQYCRPYASADMNKMALNFITSVPELEDELMTLIFSGKIQGRIDSQNKILHANQHDQRSSTFEKSLKMGEDYQRRTKLMILRATMIGNDIMIKDTEDDDDEDEPKGKAKKNKLDKTSKMNPLARTVRAN